MIKARATADAAATLRTTLGRHSSPLPLVDDKALRCVRCELDAENASTTAGAVKRTIDNCFSIMMD
jgi:hypothetical protein